MVQGNWVGDPRSVSFFFSLLKLSECLFYLSVLYISVVLPSWEFIYLFISFHNYNNMKFILHSNELPLYRFRSALDNVFTSESNILPWNLKVYTQAGVNVSSHMLMYCSVNDIKQWITKRLIHFSSLPLSHTCTHNTRTRKHTHTHTHTHKYK